MIERALELLAELRENWDDHYWWARHQALQIVCLSLLSGAIGLVFTWLENRIKVSA